jgi:DASS family divalent anion:Na+ symporter
MTASRSAIGRYLAVVYAQSNATCSCLFMTGMISNVIICDVARQNGVILTWGSWMRFAAIPCLIILGLIPIINFFTVSPSVYKLNDVKKLVEENSKTLGKLTLTEKIVVATFAVMLIFWILADIIKIDIATTTLLGLCVFLSLRIVSVKDILSDYKSLSSVIMLGLLFSFINSLTHLGVIEWFNSLIAAQIQSISPSFRFCSLASIYFFTHYFFSGEGTRVLALYASFLTIGIGLGLDKFTLAMTLALFSTLSNMVAHYTSPMIITLFNCGYSSIPKWIFSGTVMAIISLVVVLIFAALYQC